MDFGRKTLYASYQGPENTVTNVEVSLGRSFEHVHVQELIKRKGFSVVRSAETHKFSLNEVSVDELDGHD